jgi:subfamily B ATP-binding cassette protein MsbA
MFEKILTAQGELFSRQTSSAISNTAVYEIQTGATMLVASILSLTRNALTVIALTAYLFYLNWKLTLIVVAIFPAVAVVMRVLTRRLHTLTKSSQDATDDLAYVVEENVLAYKDIRLYGAQKSQAERFQNLSNTLRQIAMKSTAAGAAMTPLTQMLAAIALSIVISVALVQSASAGTSVGGFVAFVTAMLMIIAPIRQLSEVSSPITRGLAALERGLELIEHTACESQGTYTKEKVEGHIEFCGVTVQYPTGGNPALSSLSLSIKPGETVAFVGSSGSGKTTLVNLLPRFVQFQSGSVFVDGKDVLDWNLASLRAQFAYVSQHVVMINDTIASNVALGHAPDLAKVARCLDAANLTSMISNLPGGVDTIVGHNALQLSGGQRQRLAIARALYKDAPILILDEATSALDSESERSIQDALTRLMSNRTTLVVAHRLSTIKHADRIVVMDQGQIVEIGTHADLIRNPGHYEKLYRIGNDPVEAASP